MSRKSWLTIGEDASPLGDEFVSFDKINLEPALRKAGASDLIISDYRKERELKHAKDIS